MFDIAARLADRGTMLVAAIVVALAIAFVYEHSLFGALQYVTAFAYYLAVMVALLPLPALLRRRGHYALTNWLALLLAALYAGNGIYVGRGQTVLLLTIGGVAMGLLVGIAAARRPEPLPQA
jgi:uncharacterized membrane protein YhaH (DUF805 family)